MTTWATGRIGEFSGQYRFLSNFHLVWVEYEGVYYPSVEHAYQAAKSHDPAVRHLFTNEALTPGQAKKLIRKYDLPPDWEQIKLGIMLELLRKKFEHPHLRQLLLDTGALELVEGNWWGDTYWGVCQGVGQNNLGRLLMHVREELRAGSIGAIR